MPLTALDYEEIRGLLARYNFAVDSGDDDAWVGCFTDDGLFEAVGLPDGHPLAGRREGPAALKEFAATVASLFGGGARHWNTNIEITGDGDEAAVRCYLLLLLAGPPAEMAATGIYQDRLRKVDGRWRFRERKVTTDS